MKIKELKEYLSRWPEDEEVCFLAIKPKDRIVWTGDQIRVIGITDSEMPVIGLELYQSEPMDEEMIRAAEADEAAAGWIPAGKIGERIEAAYQYICHGSAYKNEEVYRSGVDEMYKVAMNAIRCAECAKEEVMDEVQRL